jgi:hypothetical protein
VVGATVVVVELDVVVGSVVVVVVLDVVVGSVVVVVELDVVVGSVVVVVVLDVVVGATVVVVDLGGLVGLGGLGGFAPAEGKTNPTATAMATSAKTMTRRRMPAPSLGCIVTALTSASTAAGPRRSLPRCFRGLGQQLNQSRVVSERPLRLATVLPVATPTPLAPLPAESLESETTAGWPPPPRPR